MHASAIVNATFLLENKNHYNNNSLVPLGEKTPLIKTRLSMVCEFLWVYGLQHTNPQKFKLSQANWVLVKLQGLGINEYAGNIGR